VNSQADPSVLAAVDDLFFAAKIDAVAKTVGASLLLVSKPGQFWTALAGFVPRWIIMDLNSRVFDSLEVVRQVKRDARLAQTRVIGFFSHVQVELGRAAEQAGCDQVVRRSLFVVQLPEILKG